MNKEWGLLVEVNVESIRPSFLKSRVDKAAFCSSHGFSEMVDTLRFVQPAVVRLRFR